MKNLFIIIIACVSTLIFFLGFSFFVSHHNTKNEINTISSQKNKKKIIIFTGSGGRGHLSATEALTEYLGDEYYVQPVHVLREVLGSIDFIYMLTFGSYHSEELYNYFLVRKYIWPVSIMVWLGRWFFWMRFNTITHLIQEYLKKQKPDLIISVLPMINGATIKATQQLNIPFWVIPTDLDARMFIHQIDNPKYKNFFFNMAYDDQALKKTFAPAHISEDHITHCGFPVRSAFLKEYDKKALQIKYAIPENKTVIMLLMGGLGSQDTITFARKLAAIQKQIHVLICIGKNESVRAELEQIQLHNNVTFSIIGFTKYIAELMAISDLFITKSGGLSVNEALYMELPMIIDSTTPALEWEAFNRKFVEINSFGHILKDINNLQNSVETLISDNTLLQTYKNNMRTLKKENPLIAVNTIVHKLTTPQTSN